VSKKILLSAWATSRYDPAPSAWVLRKWVREGQIYPTPELVGKAYYVEENARRITADARALTGSLVDRIKAAA
jgi:predicted site-specific integrase-resolvase